MKLLLYCTKAKPRLVYRQWTSTLDQIGIDNSFEGFLCGSEKSVGINELGECKQLNGKIVAECDYEVEEIKLLEDSNATMITNTLSEKELLKKSCLEGYELGNYLYDNLWCGKNGYAIHIKNLHIFDEPRELSYYYRYCPYSYNPLQPIKVAPQNMMYAYNFKDYDEKPEYILISIKPQWLCKILNGEKTIEVRKKVLRGDD